MDLFNLIAGSLCAILALASAYPLWGADDMIVKTQMLFTKG
jgi:hypothetical protein